MDDRMMRMFLESLSFQPGRPGMRPERQIPLPENIPPLDRHLLRTAPIDPEGRKGPQFDPGPVPMEYLMPGGKVYNPYFSQGEIEPLLAQQKPEDAIKQGQDNKLLQWMQANQQPPRDAGDNKGLA